MQNRLLKLFFLLLVTATTSKAFAQANPQEDTQENPVSIVEQNLPNAAAASDQPSENKAENIKASDLGELKNSTLLNQAQGGLANVLLGKKASSLMFDDEESGNIDRAVESFKNNQIYTPDENANPEELSGASEEERKLLEEAARAEEEKRNADNEKSYIYLASLLYFSKNDWIVWINEQKITSKTNNPEKELSVEAIDRGSVKMLWKLSISKWKIISGSRSEADIPKTNENNQIEIRFTLKPNQTFVLSSNNVVEGKALVALLKKKEDDKKTPISKAGDTRLAP